ncbi:uncharacterized protein LOC132639546 [Lycium barbarum]|uniref:uncharacterized protein LOC132639546 n=1 Tax=Lycium barbarum TaxID=112863 RepID=UPI00293F0971|nr:uncharacterized protein LOC132639546 [Lycium barbarum]
MVMQNRTASQTLPNLTPPPDVRQKRPMPPAFPNLDEFDQGDHFANFQQVQNASNAPLLYMPAPSKAHNVSLTHHDPPVYSYATVPPVTQTQGLWRPNVDPYVETKREARALSDEMVNRKLQSLEDAMRGLRGLGSNQSVRYEELCAFPKVEWPPSYNIPRFEKFDGSGNPFFHLKVYCEKLKCVGKDQGIRVKLFNQSLSGKTLEWYSKQDMTKWHSWDDLSNASANHYKFHVEIAPDRISISKLKLKSTESFRENAIR